MHKNKNIIILFITLILVLINRKIKFYITVPYIRWFMVCYFNDMVGAITFVSYCNEVFRRYKSIVTSLWKIEILLCMCGMFWEYVTPLFRKDTISDPCDIIAYLIGGIIYWYLLKVCKVK